jgi:aryl carrier-like protein
VGLYERLLKERAEEEQCQDKPLLRIRGLDKVLVRQLQAPGRRPGYAADLSMMHRLIARGPSNRGESMQFGSLKAKYRKEYGELKAERRGQELL